MKAYKAIFNISVTIAGLVLSACGGSPLDFEKSRFQQKVGEAVGSYARGVSNAYKSTRSSGGYRGVAGWGQSSTMGSYQMPGYGQLYGGQVIREALYQDAQDCADMAEAVPATSEQNYQFMVAGLARCLDRIITHRNPILTFAYRNMNQSAQQQFGYLLNYRRPSTLEDAGSYGDDMGMLSSFLGGGAW